MCNFLCRNNFEFVSNTPVCLLMFSKWRSPCTKIRGHQFRPLSDRRGARYTQYRHNGLNNISRLYTILLNYRGFLFKVKKYVYLIVQWGFLISLIFCGVLKSKRIRFYLSYSSRSAVSKQRKIRNRFTLLELLYSRTSDLKAVVLPPIKCLKLHLYFR